MGRSSNGVKPLNERSLYWWQTGVIYQIYPRSYQDTTGNGVGDLAGVIQRLDYLSDTLGVDAIWLSPFYPSPMDDFGYDVSDYTDVHPMFGDLQTFDKLVKEAHRRCLKVIIDIVPNHSSDQHPWFLESRSSVDNPKRDWYVWRDAKPDGSPPNNWTAVFGGPAWTWDETTGQYYMHSFLASQPDLNWRNPEVKQAMFDVYRFWLERGVDGFRIDVAHRIMKDPELRDEPVNAHIAADVDTFKSLGEYDKLDHIYSQGHPDVHKVYQELREILDEYSATSPRMMVGEIHIFELDEWAQYYGPQLNEFHLPFNFGLIGIPWDAQRIRSWVDAIEAAVPEGGWPNHVMGNHDEHRLASRYGMEQARVAAILLLTLRGTPTLYYGDEIGMTDVPIAFNRRQDPFGKDDPASTLGRDPERSPMQWSDAPNAGFAAPTVERTWLPIARDFDEVNVATELGQSDSLLNLYRALLTYRRGSEALRWGAYEPVDVQYDDCYVYWRETGTERLLVVLNFGDSGRVLNIIGAAGGTIMVSTHLDRHESLQTDTVTLRGNEGLLIKL